MRTLVSSLALLLATASVASANGRPAGTSSINFRQGTETEIAAGMTFGLIVSKDNGATWHWFCEEALQYGGVYDPIYAYTSTGALFASTFDGALVSRDACTFNNFFFAKKFVSTLSQGADGAVFMALSQPPNEAASDPGDSKIYRSNDNGMTFPVSAQPGQLNDWWQTVKQAPSNAQRVYLSGYRLASTGRTQLLFRSNDGGATYTPMDLTSLVFTNDSTIEVVGIDKDDPDHVYLRIDFQRAGVLDEAIFKTTNGGTSWTKIYAKNATLTFLKRANDDLVVASQIEGAMVSHDDGTTWQPLAAAPHINCLSENSAGEVWACTQNFGSPGVPSDNAGIMKSTDLQTWTPVMRYQDIAGPADCPAGTVQFDECVLGGDTPNNAPWCGIHTQFGTASNPTCCDQFVQPPGLCAAAPDAGMGSGGGEDGCCDTSGTGAPTGLVGSLIVGGLLFLRRRRAAC